MHLHHMLRANPPPPLCPSNSNGPQIDGTNAQYCLDKGVAYTLHCAWYMRKDMVYYSENQGAKCATKVTKP